MAKLQRTTELGCDTPPVCRLGLATRGNTHLSVDDVHRAIAAGVNYLNWCGHIDGMSQAVSELSAAARARVVVAKQFFASDAEAAKRELAETLETLDCGYIDCLTFYYVESQSEWQRIVGPGGALCELRGAQERGELRLIGLTTHQRPLAAEWLTSGCLDMAMVRYNAAHRGAEEDVFAVAAEFNVPIVAFTCQRWGGLAKATPDDPPGYTPPAAREWYRFVLAHPQVAVALMAPGSGSELDENLTLLEDWRAPSATELNELRAHGQRVRQHGGGFP